MGAGKSGIHANSVRCLTIFSPEIRAVTAKKRRRTASFLVLHRKISIAQNYAFGHYG